MPAHKSQKLNSVNIFPRPPESTVRFPQTCPCCLSKADSSIKIAASIHVKPYRISRSREIPYCSDCKGHLRAGGALGCVTWFAVFFVAQFLIRLVPRFHDSAWVLVPSVVIGLLPAALLFSRAEKVRLAKKKETCAGLDQAAFLTSIGVAFGKQGYIINEETFGFVREDYARMFKEANSGLEGNSGLLLPF